ncbi:MAG: IS200/IS605 family transposase [Bacteroidota bacterium]|nr:IS200/IS605 family transposase [Bacteroidota bacterium]
MSQSLSKVYVHTTFSTKHRQNLIDETIAEALFEYIGGVCKGLECNPVRVGGHRDHVHVLCLLSKKVSQSALLEEIKKRSSKWIKTKESGYRKFYWQNGYGIFSVNPVDVDKVSEYIRFQKKHHEKLNFQDELRLFLRKYRVDYDERYIWE